uniref:C3H1-type domain-containing protein n=1 Tax=Globodera rostochiensis TaxID=31243 RepID=A0A914HGX4_GLORO
MSSAQGKAAAAVARPHVPLRRVLPKGTTEAADTSVAQHRADHPLLFTSVSVQPGRHSGTAPAPLVAAQQRISLPIQQKKSSSPQQQQQPATTATSASSLADSCYSSSSDGEQQQQHLLLSSEISDCSSPSACDGGHGQAEEPRLRPVLQEGCNGSAGGGCAVGNSQNAAATDAQLVEFATRLGYTEDDLRTVLRQLEPGDAHHQQPDRVLCELIKLGRQQRQQQSPPPASSSCASSARRTSAAAQRQQIEFRMEQEQLQSKLRPIVVDGSNIAMTHGNKTVFACGGIRECVQFFVRRGHTDILVFVPHFRREQPRADSPIVDQHILLELEAERRLVWTPSRRVAGRRIVCHDDRYILKTATEKQAVIVSNDEYRDLVRENPRWRVVVEHLLLMYSFVDGKFMPPDDPLGRRGPNLDLFLTFAHTPLSAQLCPYAKKCTYGNKCKYFHPERPNGVWVSVTDRLITGRGNNDVGTENAKQLLTARPSMIAEHSQRQNAKLLLSTARHTSVGRTRSLNCGAAALAEVAPTTDDQQQQRHQRDEDKGQLQPLLLSPPFLHNHAHLSLFRLESSPAGQHSVRLPVPAATITHQHHQSHSQLSRILSAPAPIGHHQQPPKQHMYSPSTAVWGNCEFSLISGGGGGGAAQTLAPSATAVVSAMPLGNAMEQQQQRVQYHLCQLFPEATVLAVMGAHPKETDAQRLCQRIIAFQKGFADNDGAQ